MTAAAIIATVVGLLLLNAIVLGVLDDARQHRARKELAARHREFAARVAMGEDPFRAADDVIPLRRDDSTSNVIQLHRRATIYSYGKKAE